VMRGSLAGIYLQFKSASHVSNLFHIAWILYRDCSVFYLNENQLHHVFGQCSWQEVLTRNIGIEKAWL
jgi:hypothetical protein